MGQNLNATLYICNELIEETARHRKLIFGMWESFGSWKCPPAAQCKQAIRALYFYFTLRQNT